jgi:hypothetical protein
MGDTTYCIDIDKEQLMHQLAVFTQATWPSAGQFCLLADFAEFTHHPDPFEVQLIRITSLISVVSVYMPPFTNITDFCCDLHDLLAAVAVSTTDQLIVCDDMNCAGMDPKSVSGRLAEVFDELCLKQHVHVPTCGLISLMSLPLTCHSAVLLMPPARKTYSLYARNRTMS